LPVCNLDRDTVWRQYVDEDKDAFRRLIMRQDPASREYARLKEAQEEVVNRALKQGPSIIEGCQLLAFPMLTRLYETFLLTPPMPVVLAQRMERKKRHRVERGEPPMAREEEERAAEFSAALYRSMEKEVASFKQRPGVTVIYSPRYVAARMRARPEGA
jgi:hypothetical protein